MANETKNNLLIATSKGLAVYQRMGNRWKFDTMHFLGMPVSVAKEDPRNGHWWVCLAHKHWGPKVHYSMNQGETWMEVPSPKYPASAEIKPGLPATLKYIWTLEMSNADRPGEIWIGTEPGGLFHGNDHERFTLNESLWNHPSRIEHWFGGGRNHPGIHSIVVDPRDSQRVFIGVSCAGVFETQNGGKNWIVRNRGLKADFLPNPHVEVGQDPHMVLQCKHQPNVFWQQNHCGIFRSTDYAQTWLEVTDTTGVTKYGFALAIDEYNPNKAWVIPATSDDKRVAVNGALAVYYTDNGGRTWTDYRDGLPQTHCFDIVLRHALAKDHDTMAFGTNIGNLFISEDAGKSWQALNHHLPTIYSVSFA